MIGAIVSEGTSHTRHPLYEMRAEAKIFGKSKSKSNKRGEI